MIVKRTFLSLIFTSVIFACSTHATSAAESSLPDPDNIHGVYISAYVAGTESRMDEIIGEIDNSELNAVVIDVKDDNGNIIYDMNSDMIDELGTTNILVKDMPALIDKLHQHGIYAIARCVAFRDPCISESRPEWVLHEKSGEIYRDAKDFTWIDPRNKEAREYLIEVAKGCQSTGFDEVQYDYVRFPTGIKKEDIGISGYGRRRAILKFAKYAHRKLEKAGEPLSLDVFGTVINSEIDRNVVGQEYSWLSLNADYLSPMIYPSHYYDGTMGNGVPDLHPFETIDTAMKFSNEELSGVSGNKLASQAAVRPWLQGFTASYLPKYRKYGANEIKEQIKAVSENGVSSWLVWNPSCKYAWEAFR